jgi:outer membrane lipoprotein-sorting protein
VPRNIIKWLPAIIVPAIVVAGVVVLPLQAGAAAPLPERSAKQIVQMVANSAGTDFSGTVQSDSDLGLPALSLSTGMSQSMIDSMSASVPKGMEDFVPKGASSSGLTSALGLLSGSHTARVFVDSSKTPSDAQKVRIQIEDKLAERNVVSDGTDAWSYDSQTNTATHAAIPSDAVPALSKKLAGLDAALGVNLSDPSELAQEILDRAGRSTTVSVGAYSTVAGRSAYELVLTPKSTTTLVTSVSIKVDSETGLPLRVTVLASGQKNPAIQVGFSAVDFATPDAGLFRFTPPVGATVVEQKLPQDSASGSNATLSSLIAGIPTITGTGWDSIAEIAATSVPKELADNVLVAQIATKVEGGRALSTSLVNVFLATDGRVFIGSVPLAQLQNAAK